MEWARLNVFQKLVRRWEALHPYNGAQVLRLAGPPPSPALCESAWTDALQSLGLGRAEVDGPRFRYQPLAPFNAGAASGSAAASAVRVHTFDTSARPLDALLTDELNLRFTDADQPLRPFIAVENGSFWMGIAYRHWVADSVAIRRVMREWYARLLAPELATTEPLDRDGGGYWKLFGPGDVGGGLNWTLPRGLLSGAATSSRMKRVQRVEPKTADFSLAFSRHQPAQGTAGRVHAWAKRRGYKVNDVLMAALAEAITREGLLTRTPRRQDMALGTIVDLRPSSTHDLSDTFGLYLGFTTVFLRPRHYRDFASAVHRIAASHALARSQHIAASSLLRMAAGLISHRYMPQPERIAEFYRKRIPLAGGTSNVLLREPWLNDDRVLDYIRVSPTGPMMPLVLAATTLNDRMHLGLTRRTAIVPEPTAAALLHGVARRLESL